MYNKVRLSKCWQPHFIMLFESLKIKKKFFILFNKEIDSFYCGFTNEKKEKYTIF